MVRFDPALNRAIDFAIGEKLARRAGGNRVELADKGWRLAKELNEKDDVFRSEKSFIDEIQQRVTESLVNRIIAGE